MIALLRGTIVSTAPPLLVLDCNGIGYEVWMPTSAFAALPAIGSEAQVHTSMVVREDSHNIYGFIDPQDKQIFQALIRISGIGAKSALALLSGLDALAFARAVQTGDTKQLTRAPGIGRKTAERIIIELRDKSILDGTPAEVPVMAQAVDALIALGFSASQARTAMSGLDTDGMDVAALIKQGLAKLTENTAR